MITITLPEWFAWCLVVLGCLEVFNIAAQITIKILTYRLERFISKDTKKPHKENPGKGAGDSRRSSETTL